MNSQCSNPLECRVCYVSATWDPEDAHEILEAAFLEIADFNVTAQEEAGWDEWKRIMRHPAGREIERTTE